MEISFKFHRKKEKRTNNLFIVVQSIGRVCPQSVVQQNIRTRKSKYRVPTS